MGYQYTVKTDKGTYDVTVEKHHDHVTSIDFERALLGALAGVGVQMIVNYAFKGRR